MSHWGQCHLVLCLSLDDTSGAFVCLVRGHEQILYCKSEPCVEYGPIGMSPPGLKAWTLRDFLSSLLNGVRGCQGYIWCIYEWDSTLLQHIMLLWRRKQILCTIVGIYFIDLNIFQALSSLGERSFQIIYLLVLVKKASVTTFIVWLIVLWNIYIYIYIIAVYIPQILLICNFLQMSYFRLNTLTVPPLCTSPRFHWQLLV